MKKRIVRKKLKQALAQARKATDALSRIENPLNALTCEALGIEYRKDGK